MRESCALIAAAVLSFAPTPMLRAAVQPLFSNEKVAVTLETLAPGESGPYGGERKCAVVFLTGESAEIQSPDGPKIKLVVNRGIVEEPATHEGIIVNAGSSPLRFVRVEFLTAGGNQTWGMSGLPPNYKLTHEDQYGRFYEIRIPAHGTEPQHTHHDRVVICLSGAQLEHILPDGHRQPSTLKTDEVVWRAGQTHIGHNLGDTDLWVIAIEPK
jgi:hypothetical protein